MSNVTITREVALTEDCLRQLSKLAQNHQISEDKLIEKAINLVFFSHLLDHPTERQIWDKLSQRSLSRLWDNEEDPVYDNSIQLYGFLDCN